MAKLTRQLHERVAGAHKENEDWWRLDFDTEAKRFYVEHEWGDTDAWRAARSNIGTAEFDINDFLAEGEAPAQAELLRIIESLFETGGSKNAKGQGKGDQLTRISSLLEAYRAGAGPVGTLRSGSGRCRRSS